eukprot:Clim_evm11s34 gene=Clim_evmTU11s34
MQKITTTSVFAAGIAVASGASFTLERSDAAPKKPDWGQVFTVKGTFSVPAGDIHEPVTAYADVPGGLYKTAFYDGTNAYIYDYPNQVITQTYYRMDKPGCRFIEGEIHPKMYATGLLPDISDDGFVYQGESACPEHEAPAESGKDQSNPICHVWKKKAPGDGHDATFQFYAQLIGGEWIPYKYEMMAYTELIGSHWDRYVMDYDMYAAGTPDGAFEVPEYCPKSEAQDHKEAAMAPLLQYGKFARGEYHVDDAFADYMKEHGRKYSDDMEHHERKAVFRDNLHYIYHGNRKNTSFVMKANQWMDHRVDELQDKLFGDIPRSEIQAKAKELKQDVSEKSGFKEHPYKPFQNPPPKHFDWREEGIIGPIKEQGVCGGCWAFGATATLEAHWARYTGKIAKLSEQQLIDCSWDFGNNGCNGGDEALAWEYVNATGGQTDSDDYGYFMATGMCKKDVKPVASLSGVMRIEQENEEMMLNAVAYGGPLKVAYLAAKQSMIYYSSGVYDDPLCYGVKADELNHVVLVVGYGTDDLQPEGSRDYWIVRNSWGNLWGEEGYFRMVRNKNICGMAWDVAFPIVP